MNFKIGKMSSHIPRSKLLIEAYDELSNALSHLIIDPNKVDDFRPQSKRLKCSDKFFRKFSKAFFILGNELISEKRFSESIQLYRKALLISPSFAEAYNNYGVSEKNLNNLEISVGNYVKAICSKVNYSDPYNNLANCFRETNKLSQAEANYKGSLVLNPICDNAYSNLGSTGIHKEDYDLAIASCKRALIVRPNNRDARNNLANAYNKIHEYEIAIENYDLVDTPDSKAQSLECLYKAANYKELMNRQNVYSRTDKVNLRIAAVSTFVANQLKINDPYPFCKNPLEFIYHSNLKNSENNIVSL